LWPNGLLTTIIGINATSLEVNSAMRIVVESNIRAIPHERKGIEKKKGEL
jgi:hypothetical protein